MTGVTVSVRAGAGAQAAGGRYIFVPDIAERYIASLTAALMACSIFMSSGLGL